VALVLSDGRLTTSSAQLVVIASGSQYVAVTFFNTSLNTTVTVNLTLQRQGGTARQIARAELGPYEALYVRGLGLDQNDTLAGYATPAATVDYTVHWDRDDSDFLIFARDKTGAPKTGTSEEEEASEVVPDAGQVEMISLLEEVRDALWRLAPPR
jgi:hypothetical protein